MSMERIHAIIREAGVEFKERLERIEEKFGHLPEESYARYLSMQFHLTNGVQRHFLTCAAHPDFSHKSRLREFLVRFAFEEELHFKIAEKDLENMGRKPHPITLDTRLWWSFFDGEVRERPLVRLGATCILENITTEGSAVIDRILSASRYLNSRNSKFVTIHRHGTELPHGDQILEELQAAELSTSQWAQVEEGAIVGKTLYLRQATWALTGETVF